MLNERLCSDVVFDEHVHNCECCAKGLGDLLVAQGLGPLDGADRTMSHDNASNSCELSSRRSIGASHVE